MTALSLEGLLAVCERVQVSYAACLTAGPLINSDPEKVQAIVNEWMAATKDYGNATGPEVVRALVRVAQCANAVTRAPGRGSFDELDDLAAALAGIEGVL